MSGAPESAAPDHANVVAMPPLIYLAAVLGGGALRWLFGGSLAPGSHLRLALGALLLAAGIYGAVSFSRVFQRAGQDRSPLTSTPGIVREGLFRHSRNPAYVSLTLILLGVGLLLDNPWILALLLPVLLVMHYGVILREEAYLERKFGEEYLDYKRSVRRWL